jgi:hypothetical protein
VKASLNLQYCPPFEIGSGLYEKPTQVEQLSHVLVHADKSLVIAGLSPHGVEPSPLNFANPQ